MLRGAIICPDQDLTAHLDQALLQLGRVGVVRAVDHYPDMVELMRILRAAAPQIIFVSTEAMAAAVETLKMIETKAPGVQVIAISRRQDPDVLIEAMRAGIREFLSMPIERQALYETISRVSDALDKRPP